MRKMVDSYMGACLQRDHQKYTLNSAQFAKCTTTGLLTTTEQTPLFVHVQYVQYVQYSTIVIWQYTRAMMVPPSFVEEEAATERSTTSICVILEKVAKISSLVHCYQA